MKDPICMKNAECFNRRTLRKTCLALFDNGIFQVTAKILDRETLVVTTQVSHWTKESMCALTGMYDGVFKDDHEVSVDDWRLKSDLEKR